MHFSAISSASLWKERDRLFPLTHCISKTDEGISVQALSFRLGHLTLQEPARDGFLWD